MLPPNLLLRSCEHYGPIVPPHHILCLRDALRLFLDVQTTPPKKYNPKEEVQISGDTYIDRFEYPNRAGELPKSVVSWSQAQDLCTKAGKRLCESHEWELACGSGALFPYGDSFVPHACSIQGDAIQPSGKFFGCISPSTAMDMVGNVWEWTSDTFGPFAEFQPDDYKEYSEPLFGSTKVLRGGAWTTRSRYVTGNYRNYFQPDRRDVLAGFRTCAL